MYGKIPERKLKQTDYIFSCQEARKELDEYMDTENRRVNVDSAKKLAVLQHMDYEGFRQMVLGANIFPTKAKELNDFSMGNEKKKLVPNKMFIDKTPTEAQAQSKRIEGNSEKHCFNYRDFKKKLSKHFDKQLTWEKAEECYSLVKEQDKNRLQKIFNLECQADILLKIIEVFKFVMTYLKQAGNQEAQKIELGFMVSFLQIVLSIPTMQDISLNILTKKQKERIVQFLEQAKETLQGQEEEASISKVISLIKKQ